MKNYYPLFLRLKNVDNIQGIQSALNKEATNIVLYQSDDCGIPSPMRYVYYTI